MFLVFSIKLVKFNKVPDDMIRLVDSDGNCMVSFEEFKHMMTVINA